MKEELTSGGKEFLIAIVWAGILYLLCGMGMSLLGHYAFIGGIVSVLIFSCFGFFVLTHYASRFTYVLKDGRLRVTRMIGKRNKEIDIPVSSIVKTTYGVKPSDFPRRQYTMKVSVENQKKSLYIEYIDNNGEHQGLVIEPTEKLRKRIDRERIKVDND